MIVFKIQELHQRRSGENGKVLVYLLPYELAYCDAVVVCWAEGGVQVAFHVGTGSGMSLETRLAEILVAHPTLHLKFFLH